MDHLSRVKILVDFLKTPDKYKFDTLQHFKKFPKQYNQNETWALKSYMIMQESESQIESWLDELYEAGNVVELSHIPYDYHQLYGELVRRESMYLQGEK